jgi:glutathione S-transferase
MTLDLYHGLASTCSKKVRMCLFEKGLDFVSHVLNLQKFEQHDPAYLTLNPKGVMPTLVHDGRPIVESSRIIEYIDRIFPEPPLHPADAEGRARMARWIDWSDDVGYNAVYVATWNILSRPVAQRLSDAELNRVLARVPTEERRSRWRAVARDGIPDEELRAAEANVTATLEAMEADLANGPWLAGAVFSLGDIAMIPFVERIFDLNPALLDERRIPRLCDWYRRMVARPAFRAAFFFDGIDTRVNAVRSRLVQEGLIAG